MDTKEKVANVIMGIASLFFGAMLIYGTFSGDLDRAKSMNNA